MLLHCLGVTLQSEKGKTLRSKERLKGASCYGVPLPFGLNPAFPIRGNGA
jgi:hypothetical protein